MNMIQRTSHAHSTTMQNLLLSWWAEPQTSYCVKPTFSKLSHHTANSVPMDSKSNKSKPTIYLALVHRHVVGCFFDSPSSATVPDVKLTDGHLGQPHSEVSTLSELIFMLAKEILFLNLTNSGAFQNRWPSLWWICTSGRNLGLACNFVDWGSWVSFINEALENLGMFPNCRFSVSSPPNDAFLSGAVCNYSWMKLCKVSFWGHRFQSYK